MKRLPLPVCPRCSGYAGDCFFHPNICIGVGPVPGRTWTPEEYRYMRVAIWNPAAMRGYPRA